MDNKAEIRKQLEEAIFAARNLAQALTKLNEMGVEQDADLVDEINGLLPDLAYAQAVYEVV